MVVGDLSKQADLVVIGAGPGGYVAAARASQLGRKVLLIEKDSLGGVCLHQGCIPSKVLINAADRFFELKHLQQMGIEVSSAKLNLAKLLQYKDGVISKLHAGVKGLMQSARVELAQGTAYFTDTHKIRVIPDNNSLPPTSYTFKHAIVAAGSTERVLPSLRVDGQKIISAQGALAPAVLPKTLVIVGGGYIGIELGTVYAKLGAKVTVLEASHQILPGVEADLVNPILKRFNDLGVTVKTKALVTKACIIDDKVQVALEIAGVQEELNSEQCMVAVGRVPNTAELGLSSIGVELDKSGFIKTNVSCRTNLPHIYAIGDCADGGPMLAHKASYEGRIAAEASAGEASTRDFQAMPAVIFSDPEVAYAGLTREEAQQKGLQVIESKVPFAYNGRAYTLNAIEGFVRLVALASTKRLIGAQVVGVHAAELIAELTLAIELGATAEDISLTIHAHPTLSELLQEAAHELF
ncbi:MAG: dihydrolipoyl dehydrogenase [Bacillota bacterium]|jgi:dihydrolipoamide dehydrogenase